LLTRTERSGGARTTFKWNALGQLTQISGPEGVSNYGYDPLGRRVLVNSEGTTQRFVWQGDNLRGILDESGSLQSRLVTGNDLDDTLAITDGTGSTEYPIVDGM